MSSKAENDILILLVDDDPDLLEILAFSFRRLGYRVLLASNGREAFEILQTNPVNVVITDVRMPGGDGIELLKLAREQCPGTPVIVLISGFCDLSTEDAYNMGADAIFSKPFDKKTLLEALSRLLTPPEKRWAHLIDQVDVEMEIELQIEGLSDAITTKVISLGRGGMFVTLAEGQYPNVGNNVSFKIGCSNFSFAGSGIVRWVRTKSASNFPPGCGIEFTYLDSLQADAVLAYLKPSNSKAFIPNR
ncbi:MAG: response regulator [Bdellovibrionia bacterium]